MSGPTILAEIFTLESLLPAAGIALITLALMMRLRKRKRKNTPADAAAAEQIERNRQARGLRGDLEEVMVEVEQLARRFSAQLDAKSMMLEKRIQEADERIANLEALEARLAQAGAKPAADTKSAPPAAKAQAASGAGPETAAPLFDRKAVDGSPQPVSPPVPSAAPPRSVQPKVDAAAPKANGKPSPAHQPQPAQAGPKNDVPGLGPDPLARSIYQMADAGSNPVEIARALNEHVGKVELILALRST